MMKETLFYCLIFENKSLDINSPRSIMYNDQRLILLADVIFNSYLIFYNYMFFFTLNLGLIKIRIQLYHVNVPALMMFLDVISRYN